MQQLSTAECWLFVFLFTLAVSGMLWTAWQRVPVTPRYVMQFLALVALVAFDAAVLIYNSKTYL
jgi:hypothetical protein